MNLYTALSHDDVLERLRQGKIGPFTFTQIMQDRSGAWGGDWNRGVFSIRALDDEDKADLHHQFALPPSLQTKIWITIDELYEGQTDVYHLTALLLQAWPGDLALLNNGDYLRVQRVNGQISLREDCLNPERLVFYQDFDWKPLPVE